MKNVSLNYIVRIYRFDEKNPRSIVGVVENPGVKEKRAFSNYDELWEILNPVNHKDVHDRNQSQSLNEEKRKYNRTDTSHLIEYSLASPSDHRISHGVVINTCENGMCLLTTRELQNGENILLKSTDNTPLQKATVRWNSKWNPFYNRVGLEFVV